MDNANQSLDPKGVDGGDADNLPDGDSLLSGNQQDDGGEPKGTDLAKELQRERSSRGREVATLKAQLITMQDNIAMLTSQLSKPVAQSVVSQGDGDESPVQYITTPEELEKYNHWKAGQNEKRRREYAVRYVHSAKNLRHLNPDLHDEIEKELLYGDTKYNSISDFANPTQDAEYNYRITESNIMKKKLAEALIGKPPVKGTGNNPATGITATSTNSSASIGKKVQLDGYAKKFVDSLGEKEDSDWVQKSIQRDDLH